MEVRAINRAIIEITFLKNKPRATIQSNKIVEACITELAEYFAGKRTTFTLPLEPQGTPFRMQVWKQLQEIPHGQMRTYGEIANAIGKPTAARAVGQAIHHNPISIIIPCHRVIGSSGKLTGYASGLSKKEWLLKHEGTLTT